MHQESRCVKNQYVSTSLIYKNSVKKLYTDVCFVQIRLNKIQSEHLASFCTHDFHHLLANPTNLGGLSIAIGSHLVRATLGKGNAEEADNITIGGLHINMCFDQGLPLLNQRADLVASQGHSIEICQATSTLDFLDAKANLLGSLIFIIVQVSEIHLTNPKSKDSIPKFP